MGIAVVAARLALQPCGRVAARRGRPVPVPPLRRVLAACLSSAIAAGAAVGQVPPPAERPPIEPELAAPTGAFSLDLTASLRSGEPWSDLPNGYNLGLVETAPDRGARGVASDVGTSFLSFDSPSDWKRRPFDDIEFGFDDVSDLLVQRSSYDLVELHQMMELERVIPGYRPQGLLFSLDVDEIVNRVSDWWRRRRERRQPPPVSLTFDGAATLVVRDADGGSPGSISVVPLADDWVGETLHAGCDGSGRCLVEDLPSAPGTLLIRGNGAAVIGWRPADRELAVRLKPTGTLRLVPPPLRSCRPPALRVVEAATGLVVPVLRWLNPGRGSWIELDRAALPLVLPAGSYRLEFDELAAARAFAVEPGRDSEVEVDQCAGLPE